MRLRPNILTISCDRLCLEPLLAGDCFRRSGDASGDFEVHGSTAKRVEDCPYPVRRLCAPHPSDEEVCDQGRDNCKHRYGCRVNQSWIGRRHNQHGEKCKNKGSGEQHHRRKERLKNPTVHSQPRTSHSLNLSRHMWRSGHLAFADHDCDLPLLHRHPFESPHVAESLSSHVF